MNLRKFYIGRTIGTLVVLSIIGLFYLFNNYIYKEKQGYDNVVVSYRASLSGEYICLPHKNTTATHTDECTAGLRTEVGEYYAIDFHMMSQMHAPISVGEKISANGVVTPIEMLSSDHWQMYPVEGIFSVTDSLVVKSTFLSADRKSIVVNDELLLTIDNEAIFEWFKAKSELCNESNVTSTINRKLFCENKMFFKSRAKFASVVMSPDATKIGFTIETDEVSPDMVVGIFIPATNKVSMLTNYYLGNIFISFSPNSKNFAYQGNCFEGKCGLFIKDAETLLNKASLNNPEFLDEREANTVFIKWISDNKAEYMLGSELKQVSF
jgi:hypothetical protein